MTVKEIKKILEYELSPKRFTHSVNVMNASIVLAEKHGANLKQAALAGLLHDCAREISNEKLLELSKKFDMNGDHVIFEQPELLHGPVGSKLAKSEYGIIDKSILYAVYYHTIGRENMSLLEKVVFVADYIEPGRKFSGVEEIRKAAEDDLDQAMILALDSTICHVMSMGRLIHPNAIFTRNFIIRSKIQKKSEI